MARQFGEGVGYLDIVDEVNMVNAPTTAANPFVVGDQMSSGMAGSGLPIDIKGFPPVVQIIVLIVILLVLGSIPATHGLALWIGVILLLLGILKGVNHGL